MPANNETKTFNQSLVTGSTPYSEQIDNKTSNNQTQASLTWMTVTGSCLDPDICRDAC